MYVIAEKKLQLNSASLRCRNFVIGGILIWGGPGPKGPPLATPMTPMLSSDSKFTYTRCCFTAFAKVSNYLLKVNFSTLQLRKTS